jgi:hypothetical protein
MRRGSWHCQFLEQDLKTSLPRKLIFIRRHFGGCGGGNAAFGFPMTSPIHSVRASEHPRRFASLIVSARASASYCGAQPGRKLIRTKAEPVRDGNGAAITRSARDPSLMDDVARDHANTKHMHFPEERSGRNVNRILTLQCDREGRCLNIC